MQQANLTELLKLPEGPARTAAITAWIQGLFPEGAAPVLVGGGAVELLTGGAYTTGDLDFVGTVPAATAARFEAAGFERKGRHWVHPKGELFIEFPADALGPGEASITLEIGGRELTVLAPEAVIVDRLAAWQHWESPTDGVNAFLVWRATREQLDRERLARLVGGRQVSAAWESLQRFAERLGDESPTVEDLEQWAESGGS